MKQSAWLNIAICAAQWFKIARQEANNFKTESSERRLHINREIDDKTRVLFASGAFPWMFDYSELDQSVAEEAPPLSPAAQAVLDAFDRCGDNWPQALAAALYAAAHRLSHDRRQLAAIATELEGANG